MTTDWSTRRSPRCTARTVPAAGAVCLTPGNFLSFEENLASSDVVSDGDLHGRTKTEIVCRQYSHVTSRARMLEIPARTTRNRKTKTLPGLVQTHLVNLYPLSVFNPFAERRR